MDNVLDTNGVPLVVFGGAVPELAPEDLPEGASPFNQDCDYNPGSVFTRGGRVNQYTYLNLLVDRHALLGASIPGTFAPNETSWLSPNNISSATPGAYATAVLNSTLPIDGGFGNIDNHTSGTSPSNWTVNASSGTDFVTYFFSESGGWNVTPANFVSTSVMLPGGGERSWFSPPAGSVTATGTTGGALAAFNGLLIPWLTNGSAPTAVQQQGAGTLGINPVQNIVTPIFTSGVTAGNILTLAADWASGQIPPPTTFSNPGIFVISDAAGNQFIPVAGSYGITSNAGGCGTALWICPNPIPGSKPKVTMSCFAPGSNTVYWTASLSVFCTEVNHISGALTQTHSQILQASNFAMTIPSTTAILGMAIEVSGHQTSNDPSAQITVSLPGIPTAPVFTTQLPAADGTITFGGIGTNWGVPITPALVNNSAFAVNVVAQVAGNVSANFSIYSINLRLWLAPSPSGNFNWIHTYQQTDGEIDTLALDANGFLWDEDVDTNPTVLTSIFSSILPNTFAKGITFSDIEFIAFSNLVNGTDCPRQWNGTYLDRISQVGPGAVLAATTTGGAAGGNIPIQNVVQQPAVQIRRIGWGASANLINDSTPGTTLVIYGEGRTPGNTYQTLAPYTNTFGVGTNVVISNVPVPFPLKGGGSIGANINGTYTVQQVTTGVVGGAEQVPVFTIPAPFSAYGYSSDFGSGGTPTSGWFYQSTIATITTQAPVPGLAPGSQITITGQPGAPPAGYNGTWTILNAPGTNAASMTITNTGLSGGIASYSFIQNTGNAPLAGQLVTVSNTLNGNGVF
ncbi:MAG: hypothetical protein HRJ53_17595, partial [Acidobacteria bacterium Pan2503]|nr:hypothetical protein [Candidatus Acidoferrum panamensis]